MSQIGVFFYTEDEIISYTYEIKQGTQQGVFFNPPEGHDRVWRKEYEKGEAKGFDFWPRGRVAYNTNSKQFIIYHDKCIKKSELELVRIKFGIKEEEVRYVEDQYYACHECAKKLADMDEDDMYYTF